MMMVLLFFAFLVVACAECQNNATLKSLNMNNDLEGVWLSGVDNPAMGYARLWATYMKTGRNSWTAIDGPISNFDMRINVNPNPAGPPSYLFPNASRSSRIVGTLLRDPANGCITYTLSAHILGDRDVVYGTLIFTGNKEYIDANTIWVANMRLLVYTDPVYYPTAVTSATTSVPRNPDVIVGPFPRFLQIRTVLFGNFVGSLKCSLLLLSLLLGLSVSNF